MTPLVFSALFLLASALQISLAQTSCTGRCGGEYYRGYECQCDYDCLTHNECCKDYESQCTTSGSCKGRCGESFKRGRECDCDPECSRYNKCCPDHSSQCGTDEPQPPKIQPTEKPEMTTDPPEELSQVPDLTDEMLIPSINPELQDVDVRSQIWPDLLVPSPATGSEDPEASFNSESTSGSELSLTESVPSDLSDPSLDTTTPPTELDRDNAAFPQKSDQEATPGPEGTPSAETKAQTDSSNPEGELDSSTSPSASNATLSGSSSEPTPTSPAVPQPSPRYSPSSEAQSGTPGEDLPELLPEGQRELDPEGQEAASDKTLPEGSKPTATNPDNAQAIDAASPSAPTTASTGPTQVTPSVPEESEVTAASEDSTTVSIKPDQTPSATGASPSSDSPEEDAPTTTLSVPRDPSVSSSVPENGPMPSGGDTRQDNSVPQTGDLTTRPTTDRTPTYPVEQEKEGDKTTAENATTKLLPSKSTEKPKPTKPSTFPDINQALGTVNPRDYQSDEHNNTNICSGHPVGAVTTLKNGTVVAFRGHYFWMLDSNRVPGPARGITDVWGVPSPVDTVFTRCNCQGKTYFFKGAKYWRFENGMIDSGYPKLIRVGFDGLQGQITAALSVPVYRKRRESVYFFKRGGLVQKYSYQSVTSPTCGRKIQYSVYSVQNRVARQAVSLLGPVINMRLTWRGFPSTVTSAVSIPAPMKPEGYNYYLFSRSKYYNVNMVDEQPVIATPPPSTAPQNSAKHFFNCPKEV
ncbi:proteoglycan 4b isoform X2 [Esox lucius]|uniref:SMB domain-containing protein n=1 Tax=Esox lucius TaxID=8010 RepID=A0A3P8XCX9_ESOLU|nr:proteoglycan 4b isoform X2 [Esox lucius]